ncbi:MAG: hypothetical protein DI626_07320 [Micavibrio aeruginosavorus]|uniref:Uncharacterized protein n=1 Tax=Micavibrio aeruginosavorus TaxID=349221 RepID=A0A2W4ZTP1_9BACT|nr:MAG: hypothetical protein DI626_07320 [Micavibrio aeruginosavorus]
MNMKQTLKRVAAAAVVVGGMGLATADDASAQATGGCTNCGGQGGEKPPVTPPGGDTTIVVKGGDGGNSSSSANASASSESSSSSYATGGSANATGGDARSTQTNINNQSTTFKGAANGGSLNAGTGGICPTGFGAYIGTFSVNAGGVFNKQDKVCMDLEVAKTVMALGLQFNDQGMTSMGAATWIDISGHAKKGADVVVKQLTKCGGRKLVSAVLGAVEGAPCITEFVRVTQPKQPYKPRNRKIAKEIAQTVKAQECMVVRETVTERMCRMKP